jgi:Phage integrase family
VLDALSGIADWTLHDLRRTFATRLAEMGVAPHVIERMLNHITGTLSPLALVYNKAKYLVSGARSVGAMNAPESSSVHSSAFQQAWSYSSRVITLS